MLFGWITSESSCFICSQFSFTHGYSKSFHELEKSPICQHPIWSLPATSQAKTLGNKQSAWPGGGSKWSPPLAHWTGEACESCDWPCGQWRCLRHIKFPESFRRGLQSPKMRNNAGLMSLTEGSSPNLGSHLWELCTIWPVQFSLRELNDSIFAGSKKWLFELFLVKAFESIYVPDISHSALEKRLELDISGLEIAVWDLMINTKAFDQWSVLINHVSMARIELLYSQSIEWCTMVRYWDHMMTSDRASRRTESRRPQSWSAKPQVAVPEYPLWNQTSWGPIRQTSNKNTINFNQIEPFNESYTQLNSHSLAIKLADYWAIRLTTQF